jgi:hypothetical protein
MNNGDKPAFANDVDFQELGIISGNDHNIGDLLGFRSGMTKREYFAAMAMQGYVGSSMYCDRGSDWLAEAAVSQADALLAALEDKE